MEFGILGVTAATGLALFLRDERDSTTGQLMSGVAWGAVGVGGLLVLVFAWNLAFAPPRLHFAQQRKFNEELEAVRGELQQLKLNVKTEAQLAANKLRAAKMQFGTELRDIRRKIEIARANHAYSQGFQLPAARWDEYDELLAASPGLYLAVERAYVAAHHVNEAVRARWSRFGFDKAIGEFAEDGLDTAYDAAEAALQALGERVDIPFQSEAQRRALPPTDALTASKQGEQP